MRLFNIFIECLLCAQSLYQKITAVEVRFHHVIGTRRHY